MTVGYVVLLGTVTVFGGAALFAFWWAVKTGQFDHPDRQATSIFGPDEPIGMPTDDVLYPTEASTGGVLSSEPLPPFRRRLTNRIREEEWEL